MYIDYIVVRGSFNSFPCKLYMATKHIGSRKTKYIVDLARRVPTTRSFKGISCFLCPLRVHPGKLTANIATVFFSGKCHQNIGFSIAISGVCYEHGHEASRIAGG